MLQATQTNVIYKKLDTAKPMHGNLILSSHLDKDTMWCEVVVAGADSVLKPGDPILLSRRPASYTFEHEGMTLHNTSDASCLAYRQDGELRCTGKTFLYERITEPEQVTESGIILSKSTATKEREPIWVKVVAAGPLTGVQKDDLVLIAWKGDNYKINIDGRDLYNAGFEEPICFKRPTKDSA